MAKATKKQALGRGLSALLKDPDNDIQSISDKNADKVIGNVVELELEAIEVNPFQPRTNFNDDLCIPFVQQNHHIVPELNGFLVQSTIR